MGAGQPSMNAKVQGRYATEGLKREINWDEGGIGRFDVDGGASGEMKPPSETGTCRVQGTIGGGR